MIIYNDSSLCFESKVFVSTPQKVIKSSSMYDGYYQDPSNPNNLMLQTTGLEPPFDESSLLSPLSPLDNFSYSSYTQPQSLGTSYNSYSQSPLASADNNFSPNMVSTVSPISTTQQPDLLNEKRRKRRESHNAVERRRRDHINEKIQELSTLLPEFASDIQNKPNKGIILRRSVEYIRHMQLFAARQMDRTLELEQCLLELCRRKDIKESELGLLVPLGTTIDLPAIQQFDIQDIIDE